MLPSLRAPLVLAAAAVALSSAPGVAAAQGTHLLDGPLAAGGSWQLSIHREDIGSIAGVCLDLDATPADGSAAGTATGCAAGSLKVDHGLFPLVSTAHAGDTLTSAVIGGIVTKNAHEVRVVFQDGKHLKLPVKTGPRAWRHVLKMDVRYFGGDLMAVSASDVASVSAYDRHGHRLTRTTKTH
jgi:hypothetical protein